MLAASSIANIIKLLLREILDTARMTGGRTCPSKNPDLSGFSKTPPNLPFSGEAGNVSLPVKGGWGGLSLFALLTETISTKNWLIAFWFKRDSIICSTIGTLDRKGLSWSSISSTSVTESCASLYSTIFAAQRCTKAFLSVKILFFCSPDELFTAVFTLNVLILKCHLGFTPLRFPVHPK